MLLEDTRPPLTLECWGGQKTIYEWLLLELSVGHIKNHFIKKIGKFFNVFASNIVGHSFIEAFHIFLYRGRCPIHTPPCSVFSSLFTSLLQIKLLAYENDIFWIWAQLMKLMKLTNLISTLIWKFEKFLKICNLL